MTRHYETKQTKRRHNRFNAAAAIVGAILLASALTGCERDPITGPELTDQAAGQEKSFVPTMSIKAWRADIYDKDGDGYAAWYAENDKRVSVSVHADYPLTIPKDYVTKKGDLYPGRRALHPRQPEVYGNGWDDDSDDLIDEGEFRYYEQGIDNTADGFTMHLDINDPAVVQTWLDWQAASADPYPRIVERLAYVIEYKPIADSSPTLSTEPRLLDELSIDEDWPAAEIRLDGLSPETVYQARIQFYRSIAALAGDVNTPVGSVSDWYYTTTDASVDALGQTRTEILLIAFYHYYCSEHLGTIGYMGTLHPDGILFNADPADHWCGDFYSTITMDFLAGMTHEKGTPQIRDYFMYNFKLADYYCVGPARIWQANRGDFLALDADNNGTVTHTAMFLGFDAKNQRVWTIEGNTGGYVRGICRKGANEVVIQDRPVSEVFGVGTIVLRMI